MKKDEPKQSSEKKILFLNQRPHTDTMLSNTGISTTYRDLASLISFSRENQTDLNSNWLIQQTHFSDTNLHDGVYFCFLFSLYLNCTGCVWDVLP